MISEEQRARLAQRLSRRVDTTDRGDALPLTRQALALGEGTPEAERARLEGLVEALSAERVILPVEVEVLPDPGAAGAVHAGGRSEASFTRSETPVGPALAVYSSARRLLADRPDARPMPAPVSRAALAALVDTGGHLVVDPGGAAVVLPRPATAALAQGDRWLPAWRDAELREDLLDRAAQAGPVADVRVVFGGGVLTRVELAVPVGGDPGEVRARLALALRRVGASPRLRAAADRVELVPVPASPV
ncbi:SseB family protein [Schaalia naturae]|jgi:hypothetical protein|uniref:SseB family protein n=2 Tax=Schaalia naturae TaxID=635203 RepID=A0ABW2SLW7_9ACTO